MPQARNKDRAIAIKRPVLKTAFPLVWLAATYWDRAVWMEPAHTAKQMENMGCTIL